MYINACMRYRSLELSFAELRIMMLQGICPMIQLCRASCGRHCLPYRRPTSDWMVKNPAFPAVHSEYHPSDTVAYQWDPITDSALWTDRPIGSDGPWVREACIQEVTQCLGVSSAYLATTRLTNAELWPDTTTCWQPPVAPGIAAPPCPPTRSPL